MSAAGSRGPRADDFDFELPPDLIAQTPPPHRADARLLHLPAAGAVAHRGFRELPQLLRRGDLVVLNETRVIPARLFVRRPSGGAVEVLLVRREADAWRALVRPARRLRAGERLRGPDDAFTLALEEVGDGVARLRMEGLAEAEILARYGTVPLPPYIRRDASEADRERYQTVFARVPGAVAAPTAGLHFDEAMLAEVAGAGARVARLVLHVGPGTFRPLPEGDLAGHVLDAEAYTIPAEVAAELRAAAGARTRVVAVGTTVVRALESWALAGGPAEGIDAQTRLFVRPPFTFRVVDALLTNFHLPRSSLLCLVAAFSGTDRVLAAYREAVAQRYRFYSYGDASFLEKAPE